jgi:hypothetical protein
MSNYIDRQTAIDEINKALDRETLLNSFVRKIAVEAVKKMPSADVVNKTDLLGWLLAYHTKSFELKGRYPSHEVISWLMNDLSMYLFEEGEQDD